MFDTVPDLLQKLLLLPQIDTHEEGYCYHKSWKIFSPRYLLGTW